MLEIIDLAKRYGPVVALDGATFSADPGRIVGFLGPNGAGKTTTMGCVFGLARPDRGAPAPIGVAGDRVVRWVSADSVAVTELRAGSPVDVVVRGVSEAGALGADGSVWLRSDADPVGTVRRLDIARLDGEQRIAATYLPVVTIQEAEPPVDASVRQRVAATFCHQLHRGGGDGFTSVHVSP